MPLRPFKLPADLDVVIDLIPPSFQYPENPEWNIQQDEVSSFGDSMRAIKRLWPVFRLIALVYPPLRDALRGYIWEEDGKPVGLTNVIRMGATDRWIIGNVAVLPEYRRRGIARKLVEASVQFAKDRKAKSIILDVVAGNVPAYTLYEALGFEHYADNVNLSYDGDGAVEAPPLPDGYALELLPPFTWRPRYELARRVTPAAEQKYLPVEEGRFRQPWAMRALAPLFFRATGSQPYGLLVRQGGEVVATGQYNVRKRQGGLNHMGMTLDPAHGEIAPSLVRYMIGEVHRLSPGRRIECEVHQWMEPVIAAALDAGFKELSKYNSMGMIVEA